MHVQAFIPETSVACFAEGRGCELSWAGEVQGLLVFMRPVSRRMQDEPAAMVNLDALWHSTKCFQMVHRQVIQGGDSPSFQASRRRTIMP